jgi:two-component system chemotaxis sensor kinase CheA
LVNGRYEDRLVCVLASKKNIHGVQQLLADVSELASAQVQPFAAGTAAPASTPADTADAARSKSAAAPATPSTGADLSADKTVRISVERLDTLMNLVGELVTGRNRLIQIQGALLGQYSKDNTIGNLGETSGHLGRVVDQLQEEVMRARMLPIGHVFNKIPRLVRDLSRSAGKQVNLVIEGEETELDRTLIEFLGDPLIHLLRNAMDHGIESPQTRLAAGKQPTGTIRLAATHEEGHIVIIMEDDGQGIDPEKVRRSAVKRGMITQEEAAQFDLEQSIELIFRPNLSTAEKITEVSGRGVGMDVVRSNIERLSGSVTVESKMGYGTTFRITLPLTLAIVQSMLVTVKESVFAIPLAGIIESLYLSDVKVSTIKGMPTILWRDSVLPLLDLRRHFDDPRFGRNGNGAGHNGKTAVVTVAWGKQRTGLIVDGIIGNQDIVVKSLSPIMGELPGLSGGAILGDGRIALIVDVPGLINSALQTRR